MGAYIIIFSFLIVANIIWNKGLSFSLLREVCMLLTALIAWWAQSRFLWTTEYFISFISLQFWLLTLIKNFYDSQETPYSGELIIATIFWHQIVLQMFFNCSFVHSQYL
jgi:hypothetical protein